MKAPTTAASAFLATGALLATGSLALAAGPRAHPSATPKGGKIRVFVTHPGAIKAKITITGAIGDYGTSTSETKQGKVSANGAYQHVHLTHGTLLLDTATFNQRLNHARPQLNRSNCSYYFTGTGPAAILSGTGAYAGAHGTVMLTAQFAGVASKKANGRCNLASNAPTHGNVLAITGTGSVSF